MIILDTNVVSETMRPAASQAVLTWLESHPPTDYFITAVTEAEILTGIALMASGRRRNALEAHWEVAVKQFYSDQILPFDSSSARVYASLVAARRKIGRPISQSDAQIAAIARSRGATLATRNAKDFDDCGLKVVNPFA